MLGTEMTRSGIGKGIWVLRVVLIFFQSVCSGLLPFLSTVTASKVGRKEEEAEKEVQQNGVSKDPGAEAGAHSQAETAEEILFIGRRNICPSAGKHSRQKP